MNGVSQNGRDKYNDSLYQIIKTLYNCVTILNILFTFWYIILYYLKTVSRTMTLRRTATEHLSANCFSDVLQYYTITVTVWGKFNTNTYLKRRILFTDFLDSLCLNSLATMVIKLEQNTTQFPYGNKLKRKLC